MPTVLTTQNGWRVVIYPNDHRPPHVHVIDKDKHARLQLLCDLGGVTLMSNVGFTQAQINTIKLFLEQHIAILCMHWGRIHGYR